MWKYKFGIQQVKKDSEQSLKLTTEVPKELFLHMIVLTERVLRMLEIGLTKSMYMHSQMFKKYYLAINAIWRINK